MSKDAITPRRVDAPDATFQGLRRFNAVMGALHLLQGILMLVLSNAKGYPFWTSYLTFDTGKMALVPNPQQVGSLRFGPAVALFLLLSATAHFILSTFGFKWYVANLKRHNNPLRFWEYALSSSLMIVLIAMLVGMWDIVSLLLILTLNATMNFFGHMMELHNQTTERTDWTAFIYGCIAGVVPWVAIAMYLFGSGSGGAKAPDFVYAIMVSLFIFFNTFAVNMFLQYKKVGKWKDYLYGERWFIILSLVAKTLLAWQIFAGTLAPV
ncbi:MAG: heliorhodopsin HeR [Chloroflexi bacterium]|nr:heliorhodopsin HeR [Chloroflexota bacterium]